MSGRQLVPRPPPTALVIGRKGPSGLARWTWAGEEGDRKRLVKVAVVRTDEGKVARVFGLDGRDTVLLEERAGVAAAAYVGSGTKAHGHVTFADGTAWELGDAPCMCGHPREASIDPLRWQG